MWPVPLASIAGWLSQALKWYEMIIVTDANCNDHLCRHDGEEWAKIILTGQSSKRRECRIIHENPAVAFALNSIHVLFIWSTAIFLSTLCVSRIVHLHWGLSPILWSSAHPLLYLILQNDFIFARSGQSWRYDEIKFSGYSESLNAEINDTMSA